MTTPLKYRFDDISPDKDSKAIPSLSLSYNPFPKAPTVSITAKDELMNGTRFNDKIRADSIQEFEEKFIKSQTSQPVRLGFLWSARVQSSKGFGKTALLAHFLRKINYNYGSDLLGDQKVAAFYVQPEPSVNNLKKLSESICLSLIRNDSIIGSAILTDIMRTIRYRVIATEQFTPTMFSKSLSFETVEDFELLTSPTWVDGEDHTYRRLRKPRLDRF